MKPLPENILQLIKTYETSQSKLIDIIAKSELKGNVTAYRKEVLASVNQELNNLNKFSAKWVSEEIPLSYGQGAEKAYEAFRKANVEVGKIAINQKAVQNLVDNATGQLLDATEYVGRRIADDLRQAGLEAVKEKLSAGDTVRQTKANMLKIMSDKGITAIRDKNGREISLDAYASTVARTTTREATNKGSINEVLDLGGDLVQITSHFSTCPICSVYEGRIYSISGNDTRYPKLDEVFSGGYSTIHPNCTHSATPYFEEFDDNAEQQRKESNRPFTIDKDKKASIEAYNRDQAKKTLRRYDRNLWEEAKMLAPKETPKTFSAFRSMKKADSERYQQIQIAIEKVKP